MFTNYLIRVSKNSICHVSLSFIPLLYVLIKLGTVIDAPVWLGMISSYTKYFPFKSCNVDICIGIFGFVVFVYLVNGDVQKTTLPFEYSKTFLKRRLESMGDHYSCN